MIVRYKFNHFDAARSAVSAAADMGVPAAAAAIAGSGKAAGYCCSLLLLMLLLLLLLLPMQVIMMAIMMIACGRNNKVDSLSQRRHRWLKLNVSPSPCDYWRDSMVITSAHFLTLARILEKFHFIPEHKSRSREWQHRYIGTSYTHG